MNGQIKPGDSIPAKIEEGLEHSRVLVLCMSANAFGSDWAQLEAGTFRFRDPLNKERRFIPLRLDDAPIKGSLAQFLYINWLPADREQEYAKLLEACRSPAEALGSGNAEVEREQVGEKVIQLEFKAVILSVRSSARMENAPSPAARTKLCGCGTWRPGDACASSRATQDAVTSVLWSGRWTPRSSPGRRTRLCGCGM